MAKVKKSGKLVESDQQDTSKDITIKTLDDLNLSIDSLDSINIGTEFFITVAITNELFETFPDPNIYIMQELKHRLIESIPNEYFNIRKLPDVSGLISNPVSNFMISVRVLKQ